MMRIHLPMERKIFQKLYTPIDPILSALSIYQSWTMFAENPSRLNAHLSAEITFKDGSKSIFDFPRSENLSRFERYSFGERYRKVISETILLDAHSYLWKDVAEFALRKTIKRYPEKKPLLVQLKRSWFIIPDVSKKFIAHSVTGQNYNDFKFYTYEVRDGQLK